MSKKHAVETIKRLRDERDRLRVACKAVAAVMQVAASFGDPVPQEWLERRIKVLRSALRRAEEGGAP